MSTTVSAKIPDELKEELDQAEVNVSSVIRNALEAEVTERRREQLQQDATTLSDALDETVRTGDIVAAVRETRGEQ